MAQALTAIRPWDLTHRDSSSILDRLERVNRERGHFRELIVSKLQEDQAAEGGLELSSSDSDDDGEDSRDDDTTVEPITRGELYKSKVEVLSRVALAHNEVMTALDFVSLAASKDSSLAKQTMSPYLKENVPTGTLGIDIWLRTPIDQARQDQDAAIAYNVHLESIQASADNLLRAAKRLESDVKKETRYWSELMSITEKGWPLCRLPGQGRLGVRFGFSESNTEMSRAGIAPLIANNDGMISIDHGVELRSRTVRVTVREGNNILGSSNPTILNSDDGIEAHIKHARDSLFDEELFREIEREGRAIQASSLHIAENGVVMPIFDGERQVTVHFELQTREQASTTVSGASFHDFLAQAILTTSRLLLSQAHRDQLRRRSQIPLPLTDASAERPLHRILSPLIGLSVHNQAVQGVNAYLVKATAILRKAHLHIELDQAAIKSYTTTQGSDSISLLHSLTHKKSSSSMLRTSLPLLQADPLTLEVIAETSVATACSTVFTIAMNGAGPLVVTSIKQATWTLDRFVSRLVASVLANSYEGWTVDAVDPVLINEDDRAAVHMLEVVFDHTKQSMTLRSASRSKSWHLEGTVDTQDIATVWTELIG